MLKVSIITVCFNSAQTIEDCINSVYGQTYSDIEHIIIDGSSTDGTIDIIRKISSKITFWISESDKGLYDAMNKGIKAAKGDLIGILNSDDIYYNQFVIENVVGTITRNDVDSCYGDLIYVKRDNTHEIVRYWRGGEFHRNNFVRGWMPSHPTFFVKRECYEKYGLLNLDFPLAADYELMLRFLYKYNISTTYIPKVLVEMRTGGTSQPWSYTAKAIIENRRAWKVNGLTPNPITFLLKPLSKIFQFLYNN